MPKFIPYDPNQSKMVVINYTDQLQPGTLEFAIKAQWYCLVHNIEKWKNYGELKGE